MKLIITKAILWLLAGLGLTVVLARIAHGPGSVTALNDIIPWGLWKGGGVVALVAIGGAGFTLAMFTHVFHWKRYLPVVRGAVLLALLCYSSVAVGLTIDIGIWWRIVYPIVYWQFDSVLFEVAWCIILYLNVLVLEFAHAPLEKFGWKRALRFVERATIVFVIVGISLSTLHQSSLGTLFLATPFRLHPLWHTDLLPVLFFISAIGVGCLSISVATLVVHWLHDKEPPMRALSGLGGISAIVLGVFLAVRFGDIAVSGKLGLLAVPSWDTADFWVETLLSGVIPVGLLAGRRFRESPRALLWIGTAATVGIILNRVNVSGLATLSRTHATYMPSLTEWAVTAGVLSAAALFFLFATEYFGIFAGIDAESAHAAVKIGRFDHTNWPKTYFGAQRYGRIRLYSFMFLVGSTLCFGCLSDDSVYGVQPEATATQNPRVVRLWAKAEADAAGRAFEVPTSDGAPPAGYQEIEALLIDGQRDGRFVMFDHEAHQQRVEAEGGNCRSCHHMTTPYEKASSCSHCHADQYLEHDIFDHDSHVAAMGGNEGCAKCHSDPNLPKARENTPACESCHADLRANGTLVQGRGPKPTTMASGYMDAMHGLCIACHEREDRKAGRTEEGLSACAGCHRPLPELTSEAWARYR